MNFQFRTGHDNRATRVVNALAEQVLAETALLALEHVAQRLQAPALASGRHGAAGTGTVVVNQGVNGFLEHALLVAANNFGGVERDQLLEAVVTVNDPSIEVVQVRGRE